MVQLERIAATREEKLSVIECDVVFFDVDSTLSQIEGVDQLAKIVANRMTDLVKRQEMIDGIAALTTQAMNGELSFEEVFEKRLERIQPTEDDLIALGKIYIETMTTGAYETVRELIQQGKKVYVISGGYNPAVRMLTSVLGIPDENVFANELIFENGLYKGIARKVPYELWGNNGKTAAVMDIMSKHPGKTFGYVGDSQPDKEAGVLTDVFVLFAGVIYRDKAAEGTENVVIDPDLRNVLKYL